MAAEEEDASSILSRLQSTAEALVYAQARAREAEHTLDEYDVRLDEIVHAVILISQNAIECRDAARARVEALRLRVDLGVVRVDQESEVDFGCPELCEELKNAETEYDTADRNHKVTAAVLQRIESLFEPILQWRHVKPPSGPGTPRHASSPSTPRSSSSTTTTPHVELRSAESSAPPPPIEPTESVFRLVHAKVKADRQVAALWAQVRSRDAALQTAHNFCAESKQYCENLESINQQLRRKIEVLRHSLIELEEENESMHREICYYEGVSADVNPSADSAGGQEHSGSGAEAATPTQGSSWLAYCIGRGRHCCTWAVAGVPIAAIALATCIAGVAAALYCRCHHALPAPLRSLAGTAAGIWRVARIM